MIPPKTRRMPVTATHHSRPASRYSHPSDVDSGKIKTTSNNITRHPPHATPHTRIWNSTSNDISEPYYLRFRQKKNEVKRSQTKPILITRHSPPATHCTAATPDGRLARFPLTGGCFLVFRLPGMLLPAVHMKSSRIRQSELISQS